MSLTLVTIETITPTDQRLSAQFTPCGEYLVAGGFAGSLHRWTMAGDERTELSVIKGHQGWVEAIGFHPTGSLVYSGDSWGGLACHDYRTEIPTAVWSKESAHDGWLRAIAVGVDGSWLASCGKDRRVRCWKTKNGKLTQLLVGHETDVYSLVVHVESQSLLSGDAHGQVIVWNRKKGEPERRFDASELFLQHRMQDVGGVKCMTFSPDGKTLFVGGTRPKGGGNVQGVPLIIGFDWDSGEEVFKRELGVVGDVYVHEMQFHSNGYLMAVTSGNPGSGQLLFVDTDATATEGDADEEELPYRNNKLSNCHSIALHPDGQQLVVTTTSKGSNGNGRRLDKDGNYVGNHSPIYLMRPSNSANEEQ
jgi:WD40 repeat protein